MLSRSEEKLNKIRSDIDALGADIRRSGDMLLTALKDADAAEFERSKAVLSGIDAAANAIDNEIVTSLALFGAEAHDLRELVAYLKITNEMVRIADNVRGFAKKMSKYISSCRQEGMLQLCKSSISALHLALNNDHLQSEDMYRKVKVEESKSDDLYAILEKNILKELGKNLDFSANCIEILSTARKLEKIADRSVAIAKLILYARSGGTLKAH